MNIQDKINLCIEKGEYENIEDILKCVKKDTHADDVRFRLKDWEDKSIIYVPNWIIGVPLDAAEPELSQRFYDDPKCLFDCFVGLKAMQARLEEETKKVSNQNTNLITRFKKLLKKYEKYKTKIYFKDLQKENIFKEFLKKFNKKHKEFDERKTAWSKYKARLENYSNNDPQGKSFLEYAIKSLPKKTAVKQWKQLISYFEKENEQNSINNKYLNYVKRVCNKYEDDAKKCAAYIDSLKKLKEEIAIPVTAMDEFLGVLNLHKVIGSKSFKAEDIQKATDYGKLLGLSLIKNRIKHSEYFQETIKVIATEGDFRKIASKINEGVRMALKNGFQKDKVFPLLYIPKKPISKNEELDQKAFEKRWETAYYPREKPNNKRNSKIWEHENDMGKIPLRFEGLGYNTIKAWRKNPLNKTNINVIHYVDDINEGGSISAFVKEILTTGCIPIIIEDHIYGLLYIHCKKRHFFTAIEVRELSTLVDQVAIAIKNAKLIGNTYEELYGDLLLNELDEKEKLTDTGHDKVKNICEILKKWAEKVRGVRGTVIAEVIRDTIIEICERFKLPKTFSEYYTNEYKKREGALHSIKDYREHFIHPFHVFLLGYIILTKWKSIKKNPFSLLNGNDEYRSLQVWFITCMYHDIGYPSEKSFLLLADIFEKAIGRKILGHFDWGSIFTVGKNYDYINEISKYFGRKCGKNNYKIIADFKKWYCLRLLENHDHGTLSSIVLLNKWGKIKKEQKKMLYEACIATALHSLKRTSEESKLYEELKLDMKILKINDFPLSFFLQFCDNAQEWGRRVLHERMRLDEKEFDFSETEHIFDTRLIKIECNDTKDGTEVVVEIKYVNAEKSEKVIKEKDLTELFSTINKQFRESWFLERSQIIPYSFRVDARDKENAMIGSFSLIAPSLK